MSLVYYRICDFGDQDALTAMIPVKQHETIELKTICMAS